MEISHDDPLSSKSFDLAIYFPRKDQAGRDSILIDLFPHWTAIYSVCVPDTPPSVKVKGSASLAETPGTTTLN
jgi:hypothetical protein